jgi:hypothetical protein
MALTPSWAGLDHPESKYQETGRQEHGFNAAKGLVACKDR